MNRHPDGRRLTTDDLVSIAVEHAELDGRRAGLHSGAMFRSHLTSITAEARFAMMAAGRLLDTRKD